MDLLSSCTTGPLSWITQGNMDLNVSVKIPLHHKRLSSIERPFGINNQDYFIPIRVELALNNLAAEMPLLGTGISYLENVAIRPLIVYMNTNYTSIPLQFPMMMRLSNFEGAKYPSEAQLYSTISKAVAKSLNEVVEEQTKPDRIRYWVALLVGGLLRGVIFVLDRTFSYLSIPN
mmetsp:Transcript_11186/g.16777  ORF Transcript_11186/g.16777 Transcript_11186/m.16777 type:complete len:175 (-) Transcript_11186:135-659(-)